MKKFCISLREHATDLINFENKKMLLLTEKTLKSQQDAVPCYICGQKLTQKLANDKNYQKVRDHFHLTGKQTGAAHNICNLRFNVP